MKKIAKLMTLALAIFTLASCEDVPSPFGTVTPPVKPSEVLPTGDGTASNPFNVTAAVAKCKEIGSTESTEKYYVTGVVVTAGTADAQYGNATFVISDEGSSAKFTCFQVLGSDAKKMREGFTFNVGDVVVVYGPMYNYKGNTPETAGKGAAYVVTVNGKKTDEGDTPTPSGDPKGTGTQADPFNIAAAIQKCQEIGTTPSTENFYVKGIVVKGGTASGGYGNVTFDMGDTQDATATFKAFQVAGTDGEKLADGFTVNAGDEVVIYGPIYNYQGNTPETSGKSAAQIVTINGKKTSEGGGDTPGGGGDTPGGGGSDTPSSLTNGGFETWANDIPTGWKSASTASSATLVQSTDAHTGSYSCNVKGDASANKRLASQEIKLAAGTYNFSFWVKPTTSNAAQVRPGYVPVDAEGKAGSYAYGDYATLAAGWQQVSFDFTLDAETTVCLVVMNPKKSSYSSGEDVLIDDATLTKK